MPGMRIGKLAGQGRGFGSPAEFLVTFENVKTGKRTRKTLTRKQLDDFKSKTLRVVAFQGL
jgi:hypothetical protein